MQLELFLQMSPEEHNLLQDLDLSGNDFSELDEDDMAELVACLQACPNLQTLNLSDTELAALDRDDILELAITIQRYENLQMLDLSGNNLGRLDVSEYSPLGLILCRCPNLQTLNMSRTEMDRSAGLMLLLILLQNANLKTLDLSGNNLGALEPEGLYVLYIALAEGANLETLILNANNFEKLSQITIKLLSLDFNQFPNLKNFNLKKLNFKKIELSDNNLEGLDVILCDVLASCSNLQTLVLKETNVDMLSIYEAINKPRLEANAFDIFIKSREDIFEPVFKQLSATLTQYICGRDDVGASVFCNIETDSGLFQPPTNYTAELSVYAQGLSTHYARLQARTVADSLPAASARSPKLVAEPVNSVAQAEQDAIAQEEAAQVTKKSCKSRI